MIRPSDAMAKSRWRPALSALATALALAAFAPPARAATIVLEVYDAVGTRLTTGEVLDILEARGWRNDLTYRIADGTAVEHYPLYDVAGSPAFDTGAPGVGLSLAWPTDATGYSTLFLDNGGAGFGASATVNFTYRAALDYRIKLDDALARRGDFVVTAAFAALDAEATALVDAATAAGDAPTRGALGQQALDVLAQAFETLLHDYGLQRARTQALGEWWGVTVDRTDQYAEVVDSVSALVEGVAGRAVLRVVFDEFVPATAYDGIVTAADAAGVVVMGELLDSAAMSATSLAAFQARVAEYVDHFPQIDVWEIGNEVNGEWLGADVVAKIAYAADYVKAADASDTTVLTFYWQMGTAGGPATSLFQWIDDNVTAALRDDVDVVALSTWIGDAPLGIAHDEVFERLSAAFPGALLAMGELGYWSPGTTKAWWWRSELDPQGAVRRALAEHMYLANLAFPYSKGGVFWWYYWQEMFGMTPLWETVNEAYRSIYFCDDADADGTCDFQDNCPGLVNADQADADEDGLGDACDAACPDGERLDVRTIKLQLAGGAADKLVVKGFFDTTAAIDPVADGLGFTLEDGGVEVAGGTLGGPGAPVPFTGAGGHYRYDDDAGAVAGIERASLSESGSVAGRYKLALKGAALDLPPALGGALRLVLDLQTVCVETHASDLVCSGSAGGTKIKCR